MNHFITMETNKYSSFKVFKHPTKIHALETGVVTAPLCVRIKPINACNHRCSWCVYNPDVAEMHENCNRRDVIPYGKIHEILSDLKSIGTRAVILSGGGEPLIHPDTQKILADLIMQGFDWAVITNGQGVLKHWELLKHSEWIRISVDYWDGYSFAKSRGLDSRRFNEIFDGISILKETLCDVGINFVVTKDNFLSVYDAAMLFYGAGASNIRFSPVWVNNFQEYHKEIESLVLSGIKAAKEQLGDFVYSTYALDDQLDYRGYNRCPMSQVVPSIGADLGVYRCHNTSYTDHGFIGSLRNQSFVDLWFSDETKERLLSYDPSKHCNHQCANDKRNKNINEYLSASDDFFI